MNKIYKVVFNVSLGVYQVVSEWVKGRGKSSSGCQSGVVGGVYSAVPRGSRLATLPAMVMLAMGVMVAVPANANPSGGKVADAVKVDPNNKRNQIQNNLKAAGITGTVNLCYFVDAPYSSVFCSNNIQDLHSGLRGSVYIGKNVQTGDKGNNAVVIGENAEGSDKKVISLGYYTKAKADSATAVGARAEALASHSVALGGDDSEGAKVDEGADYSLAVMAGAMVNKNKKNGIAIGQGATIGVDDSSADNSNRATAIGTNAFANGNRALALGASLWEDAADDQAEEGVTSDDDYTDKDAALEARYKRTRATADDTIAIGTAARATADKATALGYRAAAEGANAQAFGSQAKATKQGAIAQGLGAESTGDAAIAQGVYSQATGRAATAQGLGAVSTGDAAIAQGLAAEASGDNAQALGTAAEASGINAIAQGLVAEASGDNAQALGKGAVAEGEDSVAQGTDAYAYGNNAQAFGKEAYALGNNSLAQGTEATADADYAIAQGNKAQARDYAAIAQGHNAQATDYAAIAQGHNATATGLAAIAQGHRATATKDSAIAQGHNATATAYGAIAQGARATAYGEGSLALGNGATSFENASIALGLEAQAEKRFAIAVGSNAKAEGEESLALGMLAQTKGVGSTATGSHAQALAAGTTVLGSRAKASKDNATAIGLFSNASAENAIAMGLQAQSSGIDAQAFGSQAVASGISSLAQGTSAKATSINAQAFGNQAQASGVNATAIGTDSQASGHFSQALGATAEATKFGAQAFGLLASAKEHNAIAIGTGTKALGKNSQALGNSAVAEGAGSQALGAKAKSRGKRSLAAGFEAQTAKNAENALALGNKTNVSVANGVALGAGSVADRVAIVGATASHTTANPAQNQVYSPISGVLTLQFNNNQPDFRQEREFEQAIKDTVKGNYGAVSVGNGTNTRQITNVAAGSADSDAVNVAQLKALANTPIIIEADELGTVPVKLGQRLPIKGAENGGITTKADLNSAGLTIGIKLDQNNGGQPAGSPLSLSDQGLKFNFDEGDFTLVDGANGAPKKLKLKAGQANAPKYFADADNDTVAPATSKNAAKAFTNEKNVLGIVGGKTGDKDSNAKNITTKINTTQNTIEVALNPDVKDLHSLQFASDKGIKIGDEKTNPEHQDAIAIGKGAVAKGNSLGLGARKAPGFDATLSGMPIQMHQTYGNLYTTTHGVAIGHQAQSGSSSTSLGSYAKAGNTYSVAVGSNAYTHNEGGVALGAGSFVTGASSVAIGRESVATGHFAQAIGSVASAGGEKSFAVGHSATASGKRGIAIGASSNGVRNNDKLYQRYTDTSTTHGAQALGEDSIALGSGAIAKENNTLAMGRGAQATVADGVALGSLSVADRAAIQAPVTTNQTANATNQVYSAVTGDQNQALNTAITATVKGNLGAVSVGDNANTRQIINVAAGSADTDAVNVAQLKALAGMPMMFEADKDKDGQDVNGKVVKRKLGEQLSIKGKADSGVVTKVNATDNGIEIAVQAGNGIEVGAGGVAVKLKADAGDVKNPLTVSAEGLNLNIDDKTLEVEGNNGDKKLKVKVANQGGISTESGQGLKVDVDGTTIQLTADGKVAAKTATLEPDTADANKGKVKLATGQNGNSLVTANTVMDAINNSGFILTAVQDGGGEATGTTNQLIKTGEKVTLDAGKNIKLAQAQGKVTIATKDDVDFNTVKVQTALQFGQDGPKIQKGGDDSTIQFTQNNGNGLVKLTGIAEGAQDNDAVSFKQLQAAKETTAAKYFADTGSATSKDTAQAVVDNKIGIVGGQTGTKADDKNIETKFDKDNNKIEVALKPDVKGLHSLQFADGQGIKIGDAKTTAEAGVAIGRGAQATKVGANAFGGQAQASGVNATAIGIGAQASNHFTQAFGSQAKATQFGAQALGLVATAEGRNATAIGTGAKALQRNGQAFGTNALATEAEAQAFGVDAQATEVESQAFGTGAQATKRYAQAFGSAAHATALNAMAFGHQANASAGAAIALGHQANASGDQALALGSRARATQNSGIALGAGSVADRAAITNVQTSHTTADPAQNQVYSPIAGIFSLKFANHQPSFAEQQPFENAIKNTVSGNRGAISIGSASGTRQLTNLAAGSEDSDAVNVAQLRALANMPMFFEADNGGAILRKLGERLPIKGKQNGGITTSTNLTTSGIDIAVQAANGIEVGANGVGVKLKADAGGVKNPLTVSAEGLNLNVDANTLAVEGENLNKKLKVKLKDNGGLKQDASGISVNIGSGLTLNPAGALTVNAQEVMRGVQLPVVYTDSRGDKVIQQNGEFFKVGPTGAPTRVKIPNNEVIASLNNGAGSTTTPMQLANVGSNININNGLGINYANRADAPNIDNIKNNAATVQDVLKVGFNLKNNQLDKDFVQAFDTINFSNGNGTVADVQTDDQGKVSTVKVNVVAKQNGGISVDAQGVSVKTDINGGLKVNQNGVGIKTADNGGLQVNQDGIGIKLNQAAPLSVDQNGLTVNVDNDTITIGEKDGKKVLKVAAGTFTQPNPNTGSVVAGNNGFVTANQVADAINNSGFKVQVNNGNQELVKTGETLQFINGKNIEITAKGKEITVATSQNPEFESVQAQVFVSKDNNGNQTLMSATGTEVSNKAGQASSYNANGMVTTDAAGNNIAITPTAITVQNANSTVTLSGNGLDNGGQRITNVAAGVNKTDAVNVSQLEAATKGASKQINNLSNQINYIDNRVTNISNQVSDLGSRVHTSEKLIGVGRDGTIDLRGLRTYNVSKQGVTQHSNLISTIRTMNEEGIKFFHTNETGNEHVVGSTNDSSAAALNSTAIGVQAKVLSDAEGSVAIGSHAQVDSHRPFSMALSAGAKVSNREIDPNNPQLMRDKALPSQELPFVPQGAQLAEVAGHGEQVIGEVSIGREAEWVENLRPDGSIDLNQPTVLVAQQTKRLSNVAAGVRPTDAANVSQVAAASNALNRSSNRGVASAMAMAMLPQEYTAGGRALAAGAAYYRGQAAIAVGGSMVSDNGKWVFKGAANINKEDIGVGFGVSYRW